MTFKRGCENDILTVYMIKLQLWIFLSNLNLAIITKTVRQFAIFV